MGCGIFAFYVVLFFPLLKFLRLYIYIFFFENYFLGSFQSNFWKEVFQSDLSIFYITINPYLFLKLIKLKEVELTMF